MPSLPTLNRGERPKKLQGLPVPPDITERLRRGRASMLKDASKRRLCMRFERGDTYWYLDSKGSLTFQATITSATGGGKPRHRIRNKYNFIRPIVEAKVSAATQRVPSYDIAPSTTDPADEGAARLSEQVALYGYDQWRLRLVTEKVVKLAIAGGGDGFAMPYFDPNVGPYTKVGDQWVGQGDVKVRVMSGNEVYWEPGVEFNESRWWAIEQARPIDEIMDMPGFVGGTLAPDATTSDIPTDKDKDNLAIVVEYYERPTPKYPDGRRLFMAAGQQIVDQRRLNPIAEYPWEPYPLRDPNGKVMDEPIIHRLSYTVDPDTGRDLGLVWQLIDLERTAQDAYNKLLEYKNRGLLPQMMAPVGAKVQARTDEPGVVNYYHPIANMKPEWEPPIQVPEALFRIKEMAVADMRALAADANTEDTSAAAKTLQQVIEQSMLRWQSFLGDLADWHARLMRHCLCLVARYYTEPRLLQIKGRFGPYPIADFKGANLMGQVNVTVLPGSLAVRTRQQITAEVLSYADRGWITPQVAMAAIQGGTAEKLIEGYELDVARANRIIQHIRDGSLMQMGTWQIATDGPPDPMTGVAPKVMEDVPVWMPTPQDSMPVWKTVFGDWCKTLDFEQQPPDAQAAVGLIWEAINKLEADQAAQQAQSQMQMAQALGMGNASKAQKAPAMPDMPVPDAQ